jgi:hypothetical protein
MENLFLCITDGYYTFVFGKPYLKPQMFLILITCVVHKVPTQQKKFKKKKKKKKKSPAQQLLKEAITGQH